MLPFKTLPAGEALEFLKNNQEKVFLMDVRTPGEFEDRHLEGALNISVETIPGRLQEIPQDKTVVVYCEHGSRSKLAAAYLANHGYPEVMHIEGGLAGLPY
ncbi:MAG: rhodanese-like domain-containing protein [Candidatus Gracilibacteria bacterium]|jgi:rhodanese-related sulfurtransferase